MAEKDNTPTLDTKVSGDPIQAYLDAKSAASQIGSNWDIVHDEMSDALTGIDATRIQLQEEKELEKEKRRLTLEKYENEFEKNVNKITENAGGLGEEYFGLATGETKKMQEEYMNAVRDGDKETQQKLKMRLKGLSTSVQALKGNLEEVATLKNDELLSHGRTKEEKLIAATCTNPENIVIKDGEWMWINPEYDPSNPDSKEFFTQEDLTNSLVQFQAALSEEYTKFEDLQNMNGAAYVNGLEGASDFMRDRIKTKIQDQWITEESIMSIMHDDFRREGMSVNFMSEIKEYLDASPNFYKAMGIDIDGPDGVPDGVVNEWDYDSAEDKEILINALTDKTSPHYNYHTSKSIVADYLTSKCEQKFYGEFRDSEGRLMSIKERMALRPEPGESPNSFTGRGGIMGAIAKLGITWSAESLSWEDSSFDQEAADDLYEKSLKK